MNRGRVGKRGWQYPPLALPAVRSVGRDQQTPENVTTLDHVWARDPKTTLGDTKLAHAADLTVITGCQRHKKLLVFRGRNDEQLSAD